MPSPLDNSLLAPQRLSIHSPRPFWIAAVTLLLIGVYAGLRIGGRIYMERVAIREIERLGGTVSTEPRVPEWIRTCVGDDWTAAFDRAVEVCLENSKATDATIRHVARLRELEFVSLRGSRVSDRGLRHLRSLTRLRGLSLGDTQVTDFGLVELKGLTGLDMLWLDSTRVTDTGLVELQAALPRLKINLFTPPCGLGVAAAESE